MNRRDALKKITRTIGGCALATAASPLLADTRSGARKKPVITSLKIHDPAESTAYVYPRANLFPAEQPLAFPTKIHQTVEEPVSGTSIRLLETRPNLRHQYSIIPVENEDGSQFALWDFQNGSGLNIYDVASSQHLRSINVFANVYCNWAFTNKDIIYGFQNSKSGRRMKLVSYSVAANEVDTILDLEALGYKGYASFGEGNSTQDWNDRYTLISLSDSPIVYGNTSKLLVVDLREKTIVSELDVPYTYGASNTVQSGQIVEKRTGKPIARVSSALSSHGSYVAVNYSYGHVEIYDRDFSNRRELGGITEQGWKTFNTTHMGMSIDSLGNEVLMKEEYNRAYYIDLKTLKPTYMECKGWGHISGICRKNPGYGYHYNLTGAGDGTGAILMVPLTRTSNTATADPDYFQGLSLYQGAPLEQVRQFGYPRSSSANYWSQPKCSVNQTGERVYFHSDNGGKVRQYVMFATRQS